MKAKRCTYCRLDKPPEGFKLKRHPVYGTPQWMCVSCQQKRKLPREVLEKMAHAERDASRARHWAALRAEERKNKKK
jgi:hypothetical protein